MKAVCLDASVWIKILTPEPDSDWADRLITRLLREGTKIVAPELMKAEVGSVLRKKHFRKQLGRDEMIALWTKFQAMPIDYTEDSELIGKAWEIAETNGLVHLYDAMYLAISEGIEYWTADERLRNAAKHAQAAVRLLDEAE